MTVNGKSLFSRGAGYAMAGILLLLTTSLAIAQLTTGNISGTVTDQSGGAIPGASVTLRNVETGISRTTTTLANGRYEAPNLPLGNYEVSVTLAGFQTSVRAGIELTAGRNAVVDHVMQVGEVTQTVTVTGEVTFVETTTATVSNTVTAQQIESAPMGGRDLTQLTYFQTGVLRVPQRVSDSDPLGGAGSKLSVSGARSTQNLYLLDGVPNGDLSGNPQGVSGNYIGAETVQEFQIVTNNYSAEYKSVAGAIVSAITKSGTNAFHGTAFWTLRNDNLDAAKWEDNKFGRSKPEFKRNQFGGSLGGPIIRDKTFFFGSFEGLRERRASTDSVTLPSPRALQGFYWDPGPTASLADDVERSRTPDSRIVPYLGLYQQLVQPLGVVEDYHTTRHIESALYAGPLNRPVDSDFVAFRMDHQLTSAHLLSGTYNWDDSGRERRDPITPVSAFTTDMIRHTLSTGLTSILSPTVLNEFNFGYSDFDIRHEFPSPDVLDSLGGIHERLKFRTDNKHIGQIQQNWGGNTNIGFRVGGAHYEQRMATFKDGLSVTMGNHSMRLGGEINRFWDGQQACSRGCNGIWRFNSWDDFLRNRINRVESFVPAGLSGEPALYNPARDVTQTQFAGYFQDNWRVLPSLTLNLGLRYEYLTSPKEAEDRVATMRHFLDAGPSTPQQWQDFYTPLLPTVSYSGTVNELFSNPTGKSFSPRVGFAWAPGGQKLSIRGGVGIFYDFPTIYLYRQTFQEMAPFAFTPQVRRSQDATLAMAPLGLNAYRQSLVRFGLPAARFMEYDQKNATMYRWSFTLQREVGDFLFSAGYTGSRAENLTTQYSGNIKRWDGWPNNPAPGERKHFSPGAIFINPNFGEIRVQPPSVGSTYHGLALGAQKRLSRGFQFQASYNLSKAIDQGAGSSQNSENLPQGLRSIYYWDQHMNRGLSLQDIRNSLVANFSYDLPRTSRSGAAGQILNGWQLNGTLTLLDGHPLMIEDVDNIVQEDLIGFTDNIRPNLIPGGNNNPALGDPDRWYDPNQFVPSYCWGSRLCRPGDPDFAAGYYGNLGPNTLTSPGLATLDFSILKDFSVTENSRIQFRAELLNFLNRPNFDSPDTNVFDGEAPNPLAGQITGTNTSAREIQFGLKFIF
jgi:hypothetical protein